MVRDPVEEMSEEYARASADAFQLPDRLQPEASAIQKALASMGQVPGAVAGDLARFQQEVEVEMATAELADRKSAVALDTGARAIEGARKAASEALSKFEARIRTAIFDEHVPQDLRPSVREDAQLVLDAAEDDELAHTLTSLHQRALRANDRGLARLLRSFWGEAYLRKRLGPAMMAPALKEFRHNAVNQLSRLGGAEEKASVAALARLPKMTAAATLAYDEAAMRLAATRDQQPIRDKRRGANAAQP